MASNKQILRTPPRTLLQRLRHDKRGNTLAIVAASMIPVAGFIGSGLDMSRAYLVKTRLQQACDAGALAARKSMSGTVLQPADKTEAERYFRYNFPNGTMGTTNLAVGTVDGPNTIVIGTDANNQVQMSATATMPNTVMNLFGFANQQIGVTCKAEEFYVNTDLMLVLDTTGSMNCTISEATTCGHPTEKVGSKMQELRTAVKTLYTSLRPAQEALEAKSLRMRIGFVQYSSNVNVGKLIYAQDSTAILNPTQYRNSAGTAYNGPTQSTTFLTGTGTSDWTGCIIERQTTNTITSSSTSIPTTALDLDIATMPTSAATRWGQHVPLLYQRNNVGSTNYAVANDTNPSTGSFPWGTAACPKPAVHLQAWASTAAFNTHVDSIVTGKGGTYHDIGMIWGTRMIAPTGIFGSRNPDIFNAVKVRRTIVLVTDGIMSPNADIYGAYGVERYDQRVYSSATSNSTEYRARHEKRFNLMCDRAKSMNIDVWVVAILDNATAISTSLTNCASSGQAIKVSNTSQLESAFKAISDKVGNLRIGG